MKKKNQSFPLNFVQKNIIKDSSKILKFKKEKKKKENKFDFKSALEKKSKYFFLKNFRLL